MVAYHNGFILVFQKVEEDGSGYAIFAKEHTSKEWLVTRVVADTVRYSVSRWTHSGWQPFLVNFVLPSEEVYETFEDAMTDLLDQLDF